MQPIVQPAARCAGPEHDIKLLTGDLKGIERPVNFLLAFFYKVFQHRQMVWKTLLLKIIWMIDKVRRAKISFNNVNFKKASFTLFTVAALISMKMDCF
jgi:hypothetical protein